MSSFATGAVIGADVADNTDGTYTVSYTPLTQGTYDLILYYGVQSKTSTVIVEPGVFFQLFRAFKALPMIVLIVL